MFPISIGLAIAASVRALFSDNSIPTFFTSAQRISIDKLATHAAQYMVEKVKLRIIRMNIASVGRYLSPRRLQTGVRPRGKISGVDKLYTHGGVYCNGEDHCEYA